MTDGSATARGRLEGNATSRAEGSGVTDRTTSRVKRLVQYVEANPIYVPNGRPAVVERTSDGMWEQVVFPSAVPATREDVELMTEWFRDMLSSVEVGAPPEEASADELSEAALWVHRVAFEELRRQVEAECHERAQLLSFVWDNYHQLAELRAGLKHEDHIRQARTPFPVTSLSISLLLSLSLPLSALSLSSLALSLPLSLVTLS